MDVAGERLFQWRGSVQDKLALFRRSPSRRDGRSIASFPGMLRELIFPEGQRRKMAKALTRSPRESWSVRPRASNIFISLIGTFDGTAHLAPTTTAR
jgi:hypothetical protein